MNPLYNVLIAIAIVLALVFFGIGIYRDSKKSLTDLNKKKDNFKRRVEEEAERISKQRRTVVH